MSRCGEGFSGVVGGDCTQIGKCLPDWQSQQTPPQPPPHLQLPRCSLNALSDLVTNSRLFFKLFSIKENRKSAGFYYKCRVKECVNFLTLCAVPEAMYDLRLRALEGSEISKKAERMELLGPPLNIFRTDSVNYESYI